MTANTAGGTQNIAIGNYCGDAITSADANVFIGYEAASAITTGGSNTAVGWRALLVGVAANNCAIFGNNAGVAVTSAEGATLLGAGAGLSVTSAASTTCIGYNSGSSISTGAKNVTISHDAGGGITTGDDNICIGFRAGKQGTAIVDGHQNIMIGTDSRPSATGASDQICLGYAVVAGGANTFTFGDAGNDSAIEFGATSISAPSDVRYKKNINDDVAGLSFINDLRPVTYEWKNEGDLPVGHNSYVEGSTEQFKNSTVNHGFIAQEVKEVIDSHSEIKDGFNMWREDYQDGRQRIAEGALVPMLVKAIQELSAEIEILKAK